MIISRIIEEKSQKKATSVRQEYLSVKTSYTNNTQCQSSQQAEQKAKSSQARTRTKRILAIGYTYKYYANTSKMTNNNFKKMTLKISIDSLYTQQHGRLPNWQINNILYNFG